MEDAPGGAGPAVPTRHHWGLIALAAVIVVCAGGAAGLVFLRAGASGPSVADAQNVAAGYLRAWQARDWSVMSSVVDHPPADFSAQHTALLSALSATSATYAPGAVTRAGRGAVVAFGAHLTLAGLGVWDYDGAIPLHVVGKRWEVTWSPAVIEPDLAPGLRLTRSRTMPARGAILAADGTPLVKVAGAAGLVGSTAPATAAQSSASVMAGDQIGASGLEAAFNAQLGGAASGDVLLAGRSLHHFPGSLGASVTTTIDPKVQTAADRVLAPLGKPAALVALDASTGGLLAVVSHPDGGYPRALIGTYPPGSTFKVITATAALTAGLTAASPVDCPPNVTVDGRTFGNAEHEQYGAIPFEEAFAKSCNTAFINVAKTLSDNQLRAAAASLGVGTGWSFPLPHFTGQIPPSAGPVEHVADAIGQGRVSVSPLGMAAVAGAVASGMWRPPRLVAGPLVAGAPLAPQVGATLRELMRAVVTGGTGTAANLPGDPVYGKTGTAEFGTGNPPQTHAWFIGFRGNVAFAVIVEGAGFGGDVAAPLAARFLQAAA